MTRWDLVARPEPGKPLIVGRDNPYSQDPRYALFYEPAGATGASLCFRILEMDPRDYMRVFDRANLCVGGWSKPTARESARAILERPRKALILLGKDVAEAFGLGRDWEFLESTELLSQHKRERGRFQVVYRTPTIVLPHPSGRNRLWNDQMLRRRAREAVRDLLLRTGCGSIDRTSASVVK